MRQAEQAKEYPTFLDNCTYKDNPEYKRRVNILFALEPLGFVEKIDEAHYTVQDTPSKLCIFEVDKQYLLLDFTDLHSVKTLKLVEQDKGMYKLHCIADISKLYGVAETEFYAVTYINYTQFIGHTPTNYEALISLWLTNKHIAFKLKDASSVQKTDLFNIILA